ncbi:MAG: hypothetical protein ACI90V_008219 [Bacillariaceae sp.]|jgi:hypothetical protein
MSEPKTRVEKTAVGNKNVNGNIRRITSLVRIVTKENLQIRFQHWRSHRIIRCVTDREDVGLIAIHPEDDIDCELLLSIDLLVLLHRSHGSRKLKKEDPDTEDSCRAKFRDHIIERGFFPKEFLYKCIPVYRAANGIVFFLSKRVCAIRPCM